MPLAVVLGGRRVLDEVFEVFLELGQAGRAGERFVEAEDSEEDVGLFVLERMAVVVEMGLARPERELVGRIAQVVDNQLELREAGVQQRLKMPVILHPLGQRVADQDDPVPFLKLELRRIGRQPRVPEKRAPSRRPGNNTQTVISLASPSLYEPLEARGVGSWRPTE